MTRLKTASLAILGTTAMIISVLASPAMAEGTKAKGTMAKSAKHTQAQIKGSQTLAKGQRHVQHHATPSRRISSANAALPSGRPAAGPGQVAGNVVGGAVATAGAIATAPFRAFDNSYNYDNSSNYYGYGYGGRDWKTYAAHNKLACTPGTMFKGPDGKQHPCQ
jgi:hypothetical protein